MISVLRTLGLAAAIFLAGADASAARLPPVDIVLDIDWTLTSEIAATGDLDAYAAEGRLIRIRGKHYVLANGTAEGLRRILAINRELGYEYVRISFYSGGPAERNLPLLGDVVLEPNEGKTALNSAWKILSFEDLRDHYPELPKDSKEIPFTTRFEKDLERHFENPARTIAIDDDARFFRGDRSKSLLWLGETYLHFRTYADALRARAANPAKGYVPPDFASWLYDRNRIPIALYVIELALREEIAENGATTVPFRDRVRAIHAKYSKAELFARLRRIYSPSVLRACSSDVLKPWVAPTL